MREGRWRIYDLRFTIYDLRFTIETRPVRTRLFDVKILLEACDDLQRIERGDGVRVHAAQRSTQPVLAHLEQADLRRGLGGRPASRAMRDELRRLQVFQDLRRTRRQLRRQAGHLCDLD